MLYKCELGHIAIEATKNICYVKSEGVLDQNAVTRWFKKFHLGCKNVKDQTKSDKPSNVDSEAEL